MLAACVALALLKWEWLQLAATAGGAFLTLVQLLTMIISLMTTPITYTQQPFVVTSDGQTTLSS